MNTIEMMRRDLMSEYPGELWKQKVRNMPGYQVVKVYTSIQERKAKRRKPKAPFAEQLSLLTDEGRLLFK